MALNFKLLSAKFAEEAFKHLNLIEKELLTLEAGEFSYEIIDSVFRAVHSIKGAARMLKLTIVSEVAHRMEDVLEQIRDRQSSPSKDVTDILLKGVDTLRKLISDVAAAIPLPEDLPVVCAELEQLLGEPKDQEKFSPNASVAKTTGNKKTEPIDADFVHIRAERLDELINLMGELVSYQYRKKQQIEAVRAILHLSAAGLELFDSQYKQKAAGIKEALASIHNQLQRLQDSLRNDAARETLITLNLQEQSLKIRMLPITTIFDKINRVVRDFARTTGKEIDFQIDGGDTELDRKVIDQLGDCLLHMIRNAVDHGIELPSERVLAGKQPRGIIRLSAFYDSGGVTIILKDDGAGISLETIKTMAVKKGLYTYMAVRKLTETELLDLIFLPGFSTSSIVTDISGRGVGMNVVRQTITEKLKGAVEIKTRQGEGTTFFIKVPITLALSRMLTVSAGKQTFALPAYSVQEVIKIPAREVFDVVGKRAVRVREQIISLEELDAVLRCPHTIVHERKDFLIMIVSAGNEKCGIAVDAVISEMDMVIKPLPSVIKHIDVISGFTIGSNDEIISVLSAAALISKARDNHLGIDKAVETKAKPQGKTVLVVDDSVNTRDIVKSILESYGYNVDLAEDGMVAIEKTDKAVYDAVITDIEMPYLDGFRLTSHLRQDERYKQIPIIIVTSRERAEDKRHGIKVGASAYIVKGAFDQNNLIETLKYVIG